MAADAFPLGQGVKPTLRKVEPVTGIEPAYSAWEADVLPLNYTGLLDQEG
jgi:hypothetical protein